MRVASKVGNLPSKFGRAIGVCVLQLLFAMYATDGQTDIWTDGRTDGRNQRLLPPIRGCIDLRMKFCNLEYLLAIVYMGAIELRTMKNSCASLHHFKRARVLRRASFYMHQTTHK